MDVSACCLACLLCVCMYVDIYKDLSLLTAISYLSLFLSQTYNTDTTPVSARLVSALLRLRLRRT